MSEADLWLATRVARKTRVWLYVDGEMTTAAIDQLKAILDLLRESCIREVEPDMAQTALQ